MFEKMEITRRQWLAYIGLSPLLGTRGIEKLSQFENRKGTIYDRAFLSRLLRHIDEHGLLWNCSPFTKKERNIIESAFERMAPRTHLESAIIASFATKAWVENPQRFEDIGEYVRRRSGRRMLLPDHPLLYCPKFGMPQTFGLMFFREQLTGLIKTLTNPGKTKCELIRINIIKRLYRFSDPEFRALISPSHKSLTDRDFEVLEWHVNHFSYYYGASYFWASTMVTKAERAKPF